MWQHSLVLIGCGVDQLSAAPQSSLPQLSPPDDSVVMPQLLLAPMLPAAGSAELPQSSFAPHSSSAHPEDTVSVF